MPLRLYRFVSLLGFLLAGCATVKLSPIPPDLPEQRRLAVPFFEQQAYHCGPAALAGVLNYYDVPLTPEQLADQVYLPDRKGSLTLEMQAAARRSGLLAYPLMPGIESLLRELAAGNPVLVLQNLGFGWWPQWHYALAVGYENGGEALLLHSGERPYYRLPLSTFMATWGRSGHWARVILPPGRVPDTAEPLTFLAAANDLEATGQSEAAAAAYRAALKRWPHQAEILFAAGNAAFEQGELQAALQHYRRSVALKDDFAPAWNNLAFALKALGCSKAAEDAIARAQALAPDDQRDRDSATELRDEDKRAEGRGPGAKTSVCDPLDPRPLSPRPQAL